MHLHPGNNEVEIKLSLVISSAGGNILLALFERQAGNWSHYEGFFQPDPAKPTLVRFNIRFQPGKTQANAIVKFLQTVRPDAQLFVRRQLKMPPRDIMDCSEVVISSDTTAALTQFIQVAGDDSGVTGELVEQVLNDAPVEDLFDMQILWDGKPRKTQDDPLEFTAKVKDASDDGDFATGTLTIFPDAGGLPQMMFVSEKIDGDTAELVFDCGPASLQPTGTYEVKVSDSYGMTSVETGSWPP